MWFLAGARMYVCVCVCIWFSTFQSPITHKDLQISIWNLVHEWSSHNPSSVIIFMTIDARFLILWDFEIFWKMGPVDLTFVKFQLSSYNYTEIYYIDLGTLVLNLAKTDWKVKNRTHTHTRTYTYIRTPAKKSHSSTF